MDSMLTVELVRHDPHALIWSPSNTAGSVDHGVLSSDGYINVYECKAVDRTGVGDWTVPIDLSQLRGYAAIGGSYVTYLLLGRPADVSRPYRRHCGGCSGRWCLACCRDTRSWSSLAAHVSSADERLMLQPWFCHWAWVVPPRDLERWISSRATGAYTHQLPGNDADLASITGAVRLCHYLSFDASYRGFALSGTEPITLIEQLNSIERVDNDGTAPIVSISNPVGQGHMETPFRG